MSEYLTGDEKSVFRGKIFEVVQAEVDEQGIKKTYEFARRSPGVRLIIPSGNNHLLMSREYRHEHGDLDVRLPGGKVFDSLEEYRSFLNSGQPIESIAESAVKREAREELGLDVGSVHHFATSKVGATIIWDLLYYIADSYAETAKGPSLGRGERITPVTLSYEEVKKFCLDGTIKEERSALMLLRYLREMNYY